MANDYEVGYGRPPKQTQFQKGRSGNPSGRTKGSKNFATALAKELDQRVEATENGRRRKVTKREIIAKQIVNKSAAGDLKAIPIALNQIDLIEAKDGGSAQPVFTEEDRLVIGLFSERLKYFKAGEGNE